MSSDSDASISGCSPTTNSDIHTTSHASSHFAEPSIPSPSADVTVKQSEISHSVTQTSTDPDLEVIKHLVACLHVHDSSAEDHKQQCTALNSITLDDDNAVKAIHAGAIQAVVAVMRQHSSSVDVQKEACGALCNITVHHNNKVIAAQEGAVQAVVAAMGQHHDSADVQKEACAALRNLTLNDDSKVTAAEVGAIEAVISAMRQHSNVADVQTHACSALWSITMNDDNEMAAVSRGHNTPVTVGPTVTFDRQTTETRQLFIEIDHLPNYKGYDI